MDLHLSVSEIVILSKINDKRRISFNSEIVNFPRLSGDVPRFSSYAEYNSNNLPVLQKYYVHMYALILVNSTIDMHEYFPEMVHDHFVCYTFYVLQQHNLGSAVAQC